MPEPHVQAEHPALVVEPDPDLVPLAAFMRAGDEMLEPVLGVLNRTAEQAGRPRHEHLLRPGVHDLDAEPAAHVGRDHVDVGEGQTELRCDGGTDAGRCLRRCPDPQPPRLDVPAGEHPAALKRRGSGALDVQVQLERVRSRRDRCGGVAVSLDQMPGDIARHVGVDQVVGGPRRVQADHGWQRLVIDNDPLGSVLRQVPVQRDHHDDRLAHVVDLVGSQRITGPAVGQGRVRDQQRQRLGDPTGQVLVGVDGHQAVDVERRAHVYVEHPGVRVRAAHERRRQRVVAKVVEVRPVAAEQAVVFEPRDRLAEKRGHDPSARPGPAERSSAARRTALTMFW